MLKSKRDLAALILFLLAAGTIAAVVGWVDPASAQVWQFAILYLGIFTAVSSLASLVLRAGRQQALLIAAVAVSALGLLGVGLLTGLTAVLLLGIFTLIEIYAISR